MLSDLSARHNSAKTSIFTNLEKKKEREDEEREDLIREQNIEKDSIEKKFLQEKQNIIKNFPVPNSKEDLMELLAMSTSNAYDNDGVIGAEEEVWIQKTDQIYQKIIVCSSNDKELLQKATFMIVSLMKRLPKKHKKFTQIPANMLDIVKRELEQEKKDKRERIKAAIFSWKGIGTGVSLLLILIGIIGLLNQNVLMWAFFIGIVAFFVFKKFLMKEINEINNGLDL